MVVDVDEVVVVVVDGLGGTPVVVVEVEEVEVVVDGRVHGYCAGSVHGVPTMES